MQCAMHYARDLHCMTVHAPARSCWVLMVAGMWSCMRCPPPHKCMLQPAA